MIDFAQWKVTPGFPKRLSEEDRMAFVDETKRTDPNLAVILEKDWVNTWARDEQVPYYFNNDWTTWNCCAGRFFGKSRSGAEWVRWLVFTVFKDIPIRIGIVCPLNSDVEDVVINGESGFLNILPDHERSELTYNKTDRRLTFSSGSIISCYSAEEPEKFRGKQFHFLWMDELASWKNVEACLNQLDFCLRLKVPPTAIKGFKMHAQRVITSTPKPDPWLRKMFTDAMVNEKIIFTRGSSYDNKLNVDQNTIGNVLKYEGTDYGRQEIHGDILLENNKGIIKRQWLKYWAAETPLPKLLYVFNSYDTAFTEKTTNDPTACITFGVFEDDFDYSLIILDAWDHHLEYSDLRERLLDDWNTKYGDARPSHFIDKFGNERFAIIENRRKPDAFVIENKASGLALRSDLAKSGIKLNMFKSSDDKTLRLHAVSHFPKDGRLYILESRKNPGNPHPKLVPCIKQLVNFPLVESDDYCDAFSQALRMFVDKQIIMGERSERDDESEEERFYNPHQRQNPYMN